METIVIYSLIKKLLIVSSDVIQTQESFTGKDSSLYTFSNSLLYCLASFFVVHKKKKNTIKLSKKPIISVSCLVNKSR